MDRDEVLVVHIDGRVLLSFTAPRLRLKCVYDERFVLFEDWIGDAQLADEDANANRALYDLVERRFLTTWPRHLPLFSAEKGEPEDLFIVDAKTGERTSSPWGGNDRPALLAWSHDGAYAWVGAETDGGVIHVASGIPMIDAHAEMHDEDVDYAEPPSNPCAVGLTDDGDWRFVLWQGAITDGARVIGRIGVVDAVSIAPGAAHIAAAVRGELRVYDAYGSPLRGLRR